MLALIDTNIIIYASYEASPYYKAARAFFDKTIKTDIEFVVTWINLAEYLSFTTRSFGSSPPLLRYQEAMENVSTLLNSKIKIITESENHWEFLNAVVKSARVVKGPFFHDCRIAAIMLENGVDTILTHDQDFRKIPKIKVLDPFI